MTTTTLFGDRREMEPANVRPDLREMATFADELAHEFKASLAIRRNPFHGMGKPDARPAKLTLVAASKRLSWTTKPVSENGKPGWIRNEFGKWEDNGEPFANCTEWLKARREVLGLTNDLNAASKGGVA